MRNNLYIILFVIAFLGQLSAQKKTDNLRQDIFNLTNESVVLSINYFIDYGLDAKANKILESENNEKRIYLIENLKERNKALAAHILLTKLIEPEKASFSYKYVYNSDNTEITSTVFTLNDLSWNYSETEKDYEILNFSPQKLYEYWKSKIR